MKISIWILDALSWKSYWDVQTGMNSPQLGNTGQEPRIEEGWRQTSLIYPVRGHPEREKRGHLGVFVFVFHCPSKMITKNILKIVRRHQLSFTSALTELRTSHSMPQISSVYLVPRAQCSFSHFVQEHSPLLFDLAGLTLLSNCHLLITQEIFPESQFGFDFHITCSYYQNT